MESSNAFIHLMETADQYYEPIGIGKNNILEIWNIENDWGFIIQIDALLDAACRSALSASMCMRPSFFGEPDSLDRFVKALSFTGRTSVISLLKLAKIPQEAIDFIECIRELRNKYAHNVKSMERSILDTIRLTGQSSSRYLMLVSAVEEYDEEKFLELINADPNMLRFTILHLCLVNALMLCSYAQNVA